MLGAPVGDPKSALFLTQQMGCCCAEEMNCHCMACSLTGMSGEALMLLPHKQLSSASSSMASWVTSYFENSPSFLAHSIWMEVFAGGFPALVSPFLHSSAFSVVPAQPLILKSGSLKYKHKRKEVVILLGFFFNSEQSRDQFSSHSPSTAGGSMLCSRGTAENAQMNSLVQGRAALPSLDPPVVLLSYIR